MTVREFDCLCQKKGIVDLSPGDFQIIEEPAIVLCASLACLENNAQGACHNTKQSRWADHVMKHLTRVPAYINDMDGIGALS